jgi:hypothetical protein
MRCACRKGSRRSATERLMQQFEQTGSVMDNKKSDAGRKKSAQANLPNGCLYNTYPL